MSKYKVIAISNMNNELINDVHIIGGLSSEGATVIADTLNNELSGPYSIVYYKVVPNDKELYKFEP